jgi:hypothetical protein
MQVNGHILTWRSRQNETLCVVGHKTFPVYLLSVLRMYKRTVICMEAYLNIAIFQFIIACVDN